MKAMRLAAGAVLVLIAALIALTFTATLTHAQTQRCGSLADVLADLSSAYHETIVWEGTISPRQKLILTSATDGATWTALIVEGTVACLLTSGRGTSGKVRPAGDDI
jgi:hypothetical protein